MSRLSAAIAVLALSLTGGAPAATEASLLANLRAELERAEGGLVLPSQPPPYYLGYWVVDYEQRNVVASSGALISDDRQRGRQLRVDARVGDRTFDSSGMLGDGGVYGEGGALTPRVIPMDDDALLRRAAWLQTDAAYKDAVNSLERKRSMAKTEVRDDEALNDFSKEEPTRLVVAPPAVEPEPVEPADYARRVAAVFRDFPDVHYGEVQVVVSDERRYFISSEGSEIAVSTPFRGVSIECSTQAPDGMPLSRSVTLQRVRGTLPPLATALSEARRVADELTRLRAAPVLDDYDGPVLFEGTAAPQIVLDLLGEALSGTPAPKGAESLESPLARKLGRRVLPSGFSVVDDPTVAELDGMSLLGHYAVDDEGVPAERVSLVEGGKLAGFLMSRAPRKGFARSNGHGRNGLSGWARGRVGNLLVSARGGLSEAALRARLARTVQEEGGTVGLVVTDLEHRVSGSNGQAVPAPVMAYLVGLDGKERLVRGASFSAMSVRDLKRIVAWGRDRSAFSVSAPTPGGFDIQSSVVAPSLLFADLEVKRPVRSFKRPPVVSPPPVTSVPER